MCADVGELTPWTDDEVNLIKQGKCEEPLILLCFERSISFHYVYCQYLVILLLKRFGINNTHTHLTALRPGLPGSAGTRKIKPIWILLEQEIVSGSGISWACASLHLTPDR